MKAILIPSFKDPYKSLAEIVRHTSDKNTIISDNIQKIKKDLHTGNISKVIIVMGSNDMNPRDISKKLRELNPLLKIVVIDGINWNIPGQLFLTGKNTAKMIKKALML